MPILNEELGSLPTLWSKEFLGETEKRLIPASTQLRKRVTTNVDYNRLSPWWILKNDWDEQEMRAKLMETRAADLARAQQAVRNDWQANLNQVVYGQLMQPVYGWVGRVRWQPINSCDPQVVLIGGGKQICIPNLTSVQVRVFHPVAG